MNSKETVTFVSQSEKLCFPVPVSNKMFSNKLLNNHSNKNLLFGYYKSYATIIYQFLKQNLFTFKYVNCYS